MSEQQKWEREAAIFQTPLEVEPDFAGRPITSWHHCEQLAPDIICVDTDGKQIGVEMTEWLHQEQTRNYSRWESVLRQVPALSDWTVEVYLDPFSGTCDDRDKQSFIRELSSLISNAASAPKVYCSGVMFFYAARPEFAGVAPMVAKYCGAAAGRYRGSGSIELLASGSFSARDAADA
jgi:hypothetical protein